MEWVEIETRRNEAHQVEVLEVEYLADLTLEMELDCLNATLRPDVPDLEYLLVVCCDDHCCVLKHLIPRYPMIENNLNADDRLGMTSQTANQVVIVVLRV